MNQYLTALEASRKLNQKMFNLLPKTANLNEMFETAIEVNTLICEAINQEIASTAKKYSNISCAY